MCLVFVILVFFSADAYCQNIQRSELYRTVSNGVSSDTANSTDHFRQLFDENVKVYISRGNGTTVFHGITSFVSECSGWYPPQSEGRSHIDRYIETCGGSTSFITGTYDFISPRTRTKIFYRWAALAEWAGLRIVRYELYADLTHHQQQLVHQQQQLLDIHGGQERIHE